MAAVPSVLDDATLTRLRGEVTRRTTGPFVDPMLVRRVPFAAGWQHPGWLARVTGDGSATARTCDYRTAVLVLLASEADTLHLMWLAHVRGRAAELYANERAEDARRARAAAWEAWQKLRARIPVPVEVWHNWYSTAHVSGSNWSADHIVVRADLHDGRLHRDRGMALCQTRRHDPRFRNVTPNGVDHERVPTCKQCLRIAERWKP